VIDGGFKFQGSRSLVIVGEAGRKEELGIVFRSRRCETEEDVAVHRSRSRSMS